METLAAIIGLAAAAIRLATAVLALRRETRKSPDPKRAED